MSESSVQSLDALKAKLRERLQPNMATLARFEHEGAGVTFLLRPMNRDGYDAREVAEFVEAEITEWPEADRRKLLRYRRDKALLLHGVLFEGGGKPDVEFVELLLTGAWDGETRRLVHEISKVNPPHELLVNEHQAALGQSRMAIVLFRILSEAGCLEKLRDWMLASSDSEEAKALADDLRKWEETLPVFEALLEASDTAKAFEVGVYDRMKEAEETLETDSE